MDPTTSDRITRLFATHRLSRRQAVTGGGASLAAVALGASTAAHLFIDDCPDMTRCYLGFRSGPPVGPMPGGPVGLCWQWTPAVLFWECRPCGGEDWTKYDDMCTQAYPKECSQAAHGCFAGS